MTTIKATIVQATLDYNNVAKITVELEDSRGKWTKHYKYSKTDPIGIDDFKERITNDIKNDLKIKDQLVNIKKEIGKTFNITI